MALIPASSLQLQLLNRRSWGPPLLGAGSLFSILSPTDWTSSRRGYIIIWRPLFFLRASQFRTQFNPSTVKVISWYSSTGCTCYFHRCISYFDSLAGSEVNMQHIAGSIKSMGLEYDVKEWRLFTDSFSRNPKAVLLHNGNTFSFIPVEHSVQMKETHNSRDHLLSAVNYQEHKWLICGEGCWTGPRAQTWIHKVSLFSVP